MKKLEKIERVEPPKRRKVLEFDFREPPRSGEDVVKIEAVAKAYGTHTIYEKLDLLIRRRERWCVMGVNGAGKSTLLKLIAGDTRPDSGKVTVGGSVKLAYFAQHAMDLLDEESTVIDTLRSAFPLATIGSMRSLAGAFGFSGDDVEKSCRVLSGGEKARLVLATLLYDPPNFLVLDEPTNHLDIDTKAMLVKAPRRLRGHDAVRLPRPAVPRRALEPRPRADARGRARLWRRIHRVRLAYWTRSAGYLNSRIPTFCHVIWRTGGTSYEKSRDTCGPRSEVAIVVAAGVGLAGCGTTNNIDTGSKTSGLEAMRARAYRLRGKPRSVSKMSASRPPPRRTEVSPTEAKAASRPARTWVS